jgi:DNA-binding transcriptional LysR family regulator
VTVRRSPLADVDLNLLVTLDALLAQRSVTKAARQLGLGQPATSAALARLRAMLEDPLLVRTAQGMTLTARAEELREPLREILARIDQALSPPERFEPGQASRTFVLHTTDYFELVLLPPLCEQLGVEAPGVRVEVRAVGDKRLAQELASGCDLAIVPRRDEEPAGIYRQVLFEEGLSCLVRRDHPTVGRSLTIDEYAALGHVMVSPRGGARGHVDRVLAERGLERRILLTTPHFLVAPAVVARTDLVATVAERLARAVADSWNLRIVPLPFEMPAVPQVALWHERNHRDPGHRWLRSLLSRLVD